MTAEQGDQADAEYELRDLLAAKLRVLGPNHPETKKTRGWVEYLEQLRADESGTGS